MCPEGEVLVASVLNMTAASWSSHDKHQKPTSFLIPTLGTDQLMFPRQLNLMPFMQ